jgi:hypothetical protein
MPRLIRLDQTGHTTLAEWRADDQAAYAAAGSSSNGATSGSSPIPRAGPSRSPNFPPTPPW